jgi:hypothetical protein
MTSRTLTSLAVSADSLSPQDGRDSAPSLSVKSTPSAKKSCGAGSGLLHTPTTGDSHPTYEKRYPGGKFRPSPIPNLAAEIEEGIAYIDRRSSPTSSPLMAPDSEEQLCLPGVSPASLSVTPGSDEARKMTVRSGRKCLESSMRQDPLGSLERMLAGSSAWNSTKCLLTWNWKATPRGRSILELSASTPRTAGCESGLLPTAQAFDAKAENGWIPGSEWDRNKKDHTLPQSIAKLTLLKTPSSVETEGGVMEIRPGCDGHYKLRDQIAMLPTPKSQNSTGAGEHGQGGEDLQTAIVGTSRGLKLQPAFVEHLMGYPIGFTDLGED